MSVNLDDFVRETLLAIFRGAKLAQAQAKEFGGEVNPYPAAGTRSGSLYVASGREMQSVEFDVAVIATEGTQTSGKVGVLVSVLGVGVSGESSDQHRSETRVRFKVPIALPAG